MDHKMQIYGQNNLMGNFVKSDDILSDMRGIIETSRESAYQAVNVALIQRNWLIGYRIAEEELGGDGRAECCLPRSRWIMRPCRNTRFLCISTDPSRDNAGRLDQHGKIYEIHTVRKRNERREVPR